VDLQQLSSFEHKLRDSSRLMEGQIIYNSPLSVEERRHLLQGLFDRIGAKRQTDDLDPILLRAEAANPLYLVVLAGYIKSCLTMSINPAPMATLKTTVAELFADDLLPVVEANFGERLVALFIEVITTEFEGKSKKDVEELLFKCKCRVDEATLELLFDAFRPFSDILNSDSHQDLSLNRRSIRHALWLRYIADDVEFEDKEILSGFKEQADSQDVRMATVRSNLTKKEETKAGLQKSVPQPESIGAAPGSESEVAIKTGHASTPLEGHPRRSIGKVHDKPELDMDEELPEWRSDSDEDEMSAEEKLEFRRRSLSWERREILLKLGSREWTVDKALFEQYAITRLEDTFDAPDQGYLDLELKEILKLLVHIGVIPSFASNQEAARTFRAVIRHRQSLELDVENADNLNFPEFLHFIELLQHVVESRGHHKDAQDHHDQEYAATLIQKRLRGLTVRKKTQKKRQAKAIFELEESIRGDAEAEKRIIKIQALARGKRERHTLRDLEQQKAQQEAKEETKSQEGEKPKQKGVIRVKGRVRKNGVLAEVQQRLMHFFDSCPEAFAYMDNDGNDSITKAELIRGFERIGIVGKRMNHLCVMAAADDLITSMEFLRLFSWHNVDDVSPVLAKAKLNRRNILEKVAEKKRTSRPKSPPQSKPRKVLFS